MQSFHLPPVTREASVVCLLKHTYSSLWFCWFYPDCLSFCQFVCPFCFFNFSAWQGIADTHHLKKLCSMKRKKELDRKWQLNQIITWGRARELLPRKIFLPENTETKRAMYTLSLLWQQRMTVCSTCVRVFIHHFPLESVMLAGGRGLVLGGLRLTPQGLQGYSASALCQILRLSHSWLSVMAWQSVRLAKKCGSGY